jgi:hypothetical protein
VTAEGAKLKRRLTWLIEFSLAVGVLAALVHTFSFWRYRGWLPPPFVFDVNDTFMDWFNTAYWAHNPGAYDVWGTIYAPLSFVFLKIFGLAGCYRANPFDARDCDWIGITTILATYAGCAILAGLTFWKADRRTALFRSIAYGLGLPLLYALERGNTIMVGLLFFILIFGELARSRGGIALCAAMIINFKSYLLFPMIAFVVRREWRTLELAGIATIFVYLVTLAILGSGTPSQLYVNLQTWFRLIGTNVWDQVYYSTSYAPFMEFDARQFPIRDFIEQRYIDVVKIAIPAAIMSTRALCFLTMLAAWFHPNVLPKHRLAFLGLMQAFVAQSPGGYGQIFITYLVFLEPWKNWRTGTALVCAYLLSLPYDHVVGNFYTYERGAWLSGRIADTAFGISVGATIRPGLLIIITWMIALDSLSEIRKQARKDYPLIGLGGVSAARLGVT